MWMTLRLRSRRRGRFSKIARSRRHPRRHWPRGRHPDAVGRHDRAVAHAVVRRRLADDLPERATEGPEADEPDVEADFGDTAARLAQQEHRALHAPPLQIPVRRLAEGGAETADEV